MLPPDTYTVSQLGEELQLILSETLSGVWVAGEVRRTTQSRAGHLYFELVEKGDGDSISGSIQAVLFRMDHQRVRRALGRVGVELNEGQTIRCFGSVDFYPAGGRLQLIARDIDPVFSLGDLAQRRRETLRLLREQELLSLNASLAFPELPIRIALVTSAGSAAEHDFMATLEASPYAFEVFPVDVSVQGAAAEREIVRGLKRAEELLETQGGTLESSVVALVRGGGSKTDLAAFDSLAVARAVATCGRPVLTGLGHEIDESVADLVAHRAFKTPTATAEFLCRAIEQQEQHLQVLAIDLVGSARQHLSEARHAFASVQLRLHSAGGRLDSYQREVERLAQRLAWSSHAKTREYASSLRIIQERLARSAGPSLSMAEATVGGLGGRLVAAARRTNEDAARRVREHGRLVRSLSPERTLERGFSITRRADGSLLRQAADAVTGDPLRTQFADGEVESTVT